MKILIGSLILIILVLIGIIVFYQRQMKDICRQLAFLKEHESNLLITGQINSGSIGRITDELNAMLEEQRKEKRKYLKKEKALSDIYTNLSHDIRTPLTSLDGYFQMLKETDDKEEQERYLRIIQERICSLKEMLEELFTYTKLKNDSYELELKVCFLNRIVTETIFSYYDEWEERGIKPQISLGETQIQVLGNEQALRRCMQKIIKNGFEHWKERIEISLQREGGEAVLCFKNQVDKGAALDPEKVFDRFYKADMARSRTSTGLGLSIAREFTERMQGRIRAFLEDEYFGVEMRFPVLEEAGNRDDK